MVDGCLSVCDNCTVLCKICARSALQYQVSFYEAAIKRIEREYPELPKLKARLTALQADLEALKD